MDTPKRYTDKVVLNKYIDSVNALEAATDFILDHYIEQLGEVPTMQFLKDEKKRLTNWVFKSKIFFKNLTSAIRHLKEISIDVYMVDYLENI